MTTADLSALADVTAAAVGGAVSVMDPLGFVIAYSSVPGQQIDDVRRDGILGKQVPAEYMVHHTDEGFRRSSTVHVVDVAGALPRLAVAVSADGEYLGSIWGIVSAHSGPPDRGAVTALTRAAAAAVPLLLARRRPIPTGNQRARALLTDAAVVTPPGSRYVVLAARVSAPQSGAVPVQLAGLLELTFGRDSESGCVIEQNAVFLVVASKDIRSVSNEAEGVRCRAEAAFGVPVTFAIGGPHARPAEARRHAQWALESIEDGAQTTIFEQSRVPVTLSRAAEALVDVPLKIPAVEEMVSYDAAEGTDYAATVLALLAHESNVTAASASLYLHANTFRYRLRRTKELFGLELDDPDTRLLVWMSLRLRAER